MRLIVSLFFSFILISTQIIQAQIASRTYAVENSCIKDYIPSANRGNNDYGEFMKKDLALFSPANSSVKTIKLRFVVLQREGDAANKVGGFHLGPDDNDPSNDNYHRTIWNRVIGSINWKLKYMDLNLKRGDCQSGDKVDSKVQVDVQLMNYESTEYWTNPSNRCPGSCPNMGENSSWYLKDLHNELNEKLGDRINLFFTNNTDAYENVIDGDTTKSVSNLCGSACAAMPHLKVDNFGGLASVYRENYVHFVLDMNRMVEGDGTYWESPCVPTNEWELPCEVNQIFEKETNADNGVRVNSDWGNNRYFWNRDVLARLIIHETFHNLSLAHTEDGTSKRPDKNQDDDWPLFEDKCNIMCNHCFNGIGIHPLQIDRIHKALAVTEAREFVSGCINNDPPIIFNEDYTIDYDLKTYQNIIIKSGATVTLTCALRMPKDAKIIVERGAKFIVDGGYITNACEGERWGGIEVWGSNPRKMKGVRNHSEIIDLKVNSGLNKILKHGENDPGILHIKNASVIENGPNGTIKNYRTGYDLSWVGGIILAENSDFINNLKLSKCKRYRAKDMSRFFNCNVK